MTTCAVAMVKLRLVLLLIEGTYMSSWGNHVNSNKPGNKAKVLIRVVAVSYLFSNFNFPTTSQLTLKPQRSVPSTWAKTSVCYPSVHH